MFSISTARRVSTLTAVIFTLVVTHSAGLFVDEDIKAFSCQDGWVGELPVEYKQYMVDCFKDKTTSVECRKHCLAKKMSLILDGKMWLYQLLNVLKRLFPGPAGRESVDKMVDIILQCSDFHVKEYGDLLPYKCYKEKVMWTCILKSASQICRNNQRHKEEIQNWMINHEKLKKGEN